MTIDDYMKLRPLPKFGRVVKVDFDALRMGGGCDGAIFDVDTVVERKVRRVRHNNGWKWQLVRDSLDQESWDYYFCQDKESLDEINYQYGLI